MSASDWLKKNAPPEIQAEIQENFRFALQAGLNPMSRISELLWENGADLPDNHQVSPGLADEIVELVEALREEKNRLEDLINNPHTEDFLEAVRTEAAHQRERWGTGHDAGKSPEDWLFLMGYLGTKACQSHREFTKTGDGRSQEKALHHTISTAGACLNWHAAIVGQSNEMRPGIKPPEGGL